MSYVLGLDTSNYTTSAAIIDRSFEIIEDRRIAVKVKEGMKGIRQSEALFQHMENLPVMLDNLLRKYASETVCVCVSTAPRPVKDSYMPVFKAGYNAGKLISGSLNIPLIETSHQEGHIEAGKYSVNKSFSMNKETDISKNTEPVINKMISSRSDAVSVKDITSGSDIKSTNDLMTDTEQVKASKSDPVINSMNGSMLDIIPNKGLAVFHLSGGTTEIIYENEVIGFSADISFGQLLDRIGVESGFAFPAGSILDEIACSGLRSSEDYKIIKRETLKRFKYISKKGLKINLSGLDTQVKNLLDTISDENEIKEIVKSVFYLISDCLKKLTVDVKKQYNINNILYVGGVSSSKFIRDYLETEINDTKIGLHFAEPELSVDNAVGIAVIGGRKTWL